MTREEALKIAKPILFNTRMVLAIQGGTKTVTRRLVKPKYTNTKIVLKNGKAFETLGTPATTVEIKAPYKVGDILYVRETWSTVNVRPKRYLYKTNCPEAENLPVKWHPSLHMPKEAARYFVRVTSVHAERLQDIDGYGILAEGVDNGSSNPAMGKRWENIQRAAYSELWNSTVKKSELDKYVWAANPWVWVIEFERLEVIA